MTMRRLLVCNPSAVKFSQRMRSAIREDLRKLTVPKPSKKAVFVSASDAVRDIPSGVLRALDVAGSHIFVHGTASTPSEVLSALCDHVEDQKLTGIRLHHIILHGKHVPWTQPQFHGFLEMLKIFF